MQTDVKAARLSESGQAYGLRTRLKGLYYVSTASAGTIEFRNGGPSGPVFLTIDTPADESATDIILPGQGILFGSGMYVTMTDVGFVTAFYG